MQILSELLLVVRHVGFEDFQGEAHPGQEGQAEQAHTSVDQVKFGLFDLLSHNSSQDENWQHDPVQCQEETLEEDKAEAVGSFEVQIWRVAISGSSSLL